MKMMKRLCAGNLFKVIYICRVSEDVTQKEVVGKLTCCIDPECGYINNEGYAITRIMKCNGNISDGRKRQYDGTNQIGNIKKIAKIADVNEVAEKIQGIINDILDPDKWGYCVAAFYDIIEHDEVLKSRPKRFESMYKISVEEILNLRKIDFIKLLAILLLYSIAYVENKEGTESNKKINDEYIRSLKDKAEELEKRALRV